MKFPGKSTERPLSKTQKARSIIPAGMIFASHYLHFLPLIIFADTRPSFFPTWQPKNENKQTSEPPPKPDRDVCLRLSARPSEQQPGPVSDVHGLVPLAALPHQHWHHVLHVRVLPGRGRRWTRGGRGGRCGLRGEPGSLHGEPKTVTARQGEHGGWTSCTFM